MDKINGNFIPRRNNKGKAFFLNPKDQGQSIISQSNHETKRAISTYSLQDNTETYVLPLTKSGYPWNWDLNPIANTWISCFYPPITNIHRHKNLTLYHIYLLIKSDLFQCITTQLRSISDKALKNEFKNNNFSSCCFAGVFSQRADKYQISHSGLICIDIDGVQEQLITVKQIIDNLPHTVMSFVSPNGNGIKAVFRYSPQILAYGDYYQYLSIYLARVCNLPLQKIDSSCKNLSRSCFLPHDPHCFINPSLYLI